MINAILWLFDRLAFLIRLAGADYDQFRTILQAKLTLDNRRQAIGFRSRRGAPKNTLIGTLVFYALMGVFPALVLLVAPSPMTALTVMFALVMVLIGMSLIADFTGVLIDTTDLAVLGPRPVSGRTILAARLAHICIYLGSLALALSAVTLVTGTIAYHPAFPAVFLATLALAVTLVVFAVNLFYLAALRFVDVERFKDIIVYFQVAMFVLVVGSYQVLPRLIDLRSIQEADISGRWWTYLVPPCWFAAPAELLVGGSSVWLWMLTVEAVVIPLAGLFVVVRYLAPQFGRSLVGMGGDAAGGPAGPRGRAQPLRDLLGGWLARSTEQRAGFDLVWTMAGRDRQFKVRVYPQLAFLFLWPVIILMSGNEGPAEVIAGLGDSRKYLFLLYLAAFSLPAALLQVQYTNEFEAAWVYYALPLRRPGELMVGAFKAMACRFAVPVFLVFALLLGGLIGARVVPDILLAFALNGVVSVAVAFVMIRSLPFSEKPSALQSGGRLGRTLPLLGLPVVAGGLHYALTFVPHGVLAAILPAAALYAVLVRLYARVGWPRFGLRLAAA